jgi:hypothetical protein
MDGDEGVCVDSRNASVMTVALITYWELLPFFYTRCLVWRTKRDDDICVDLGLALKSTTTLVQTWDLLAWLLSFTRDASSFQRWRWNGRSLYWTNVILWLGTRCSHVWRGP